MKVKAIAFSTQGCRTLKRLEGMFDDIELFCKTRADNLGVQRVECSLDEWTRESFLGKSLGWLRALQSATRQGKPTAF